MTRRPCSCRMCVKATAARSAGLESSAVVYLSLCERRRADRAAQRLYTRQAAAKAVLAELTSLTPAPSEGDDHV